MIHIIYHKEQGHPVSQCNFCLVKADPVHIEAFGTTDMVACSRRVQWQHLDTGNCVVEYNIEFIDNCGTILGTVMGIGNNISFYCTDDYANSSSVIMWAVQNGVKGTRSKAVALFTMPKTIITDTKGIPIVFSSFLFCVLIYAKPKIQTLHDTKNLI